ncbi:MAG: bifunctional folylpolyglutamate synthase/dihydrofolate synthase [Candidatus Coatesbacteria bacterium]|nr:MAG: bifunctional folylpolyglutamate synthase/dihydrofolate synthase [Candidatus Coatesbacteria bacterium]
MEVSEGYIEALEFLDGLVNYEKGERFPKYDTRAYDLEKFAEALRALGDPHRSYPVIHIAGSKGKGSTAYMLSEVLRAAGYKVGMFTSPHLRSVRERIQVDGALIPPRDFGDAVAIVKDAFGEPEPKFRTYFETITAAAFLYFAWHTVDVAVVEVGLGGRLDATNVVDPAVSVITSLDLEHTHVLGDTLADIAREQAGIIKPGRPAVSAPQDRVGMGVLHERAADVGVPLYVVGEDCAVEFDGRTMTYFGVTGAKSGIVPAIPATVQRTNAATALLALEQLIEFDVPETAVRSGMANAAAPARCQVIPGKPVMVLDTACTATAAENLLETVRGIRGSRLVALCGFSLDKDVEGVAEAIGPDAYAVVAASADVPRAMPVGEVLGHFVGLCERLEPGVTPADGLVKARRLAGRNGLVAITGSFYLAGEILEQLEGAIP